MSRKVFDAIMAGIEAAVARAKAAGRVDETPPIKRLRRARRRATDGYSRSDVTKLGASFPTRGRLCHQCGLRIPEFAELSKASQRRISALAAKDRPMMAIQELRALTRCSLLWAQLWVQHKGRPRALRPGPPCRFCDEPLHDSRSQHCPQCGRDWQADSRWDPDRKPIPIDPMARCHPHWVRAAKQAGRLTLRSAPPPARPRPCRGQGRGP